MRKLGLIAGGGGLPAALAAHCLKIDRPLFVVRLKGFAESNLDGYPGEMVGLAELGRGFRALKANGCHGVCFAGSVSRPDLARLKPDLRGLAALPGAILAARRGDDGLLRYMVEQFEKEGFIVEGAHEVMGDLTLPVGPIGRVKPRPADMEDALRAMEVARSIGRLDVGQGAVCCDGLILAVEAQEGTDGMLRRVAALPAAIRGDPSSPRGALAKACKPQQDRRVDLPTIGPSTVRLAAAAGLAGIAGEADRILVVDRIDLTELADQLGLFVIGIASSSV